MDIKFKYNFNYFIFKKLCDMFFALILIILFSPIFILISILVFLFNGNPVIFQQKRPGLKSSPFSIIKFRTMDNKNNSNKLLSDKERLTKIGIFLRKTSLDELPSLFNIIKGEMSFVGPRPLLMEYLELYDKIQIRRQDVLPGLTGLAQISGRNNISWKKKLSLDIRYVDNLSFILDFKILLITIFKVLIRKDIELEEKFKGKEY